MYMKSDAQMLADLIEISSPGPSGSSTSTTATPGGVDRTARMRRFYTGGVPVPTLPRLRTMRPMAAEVLRVDREPGVANVTIDSPPLQLVDGPFLGALLQLLPGLEADDDLRVVLFRSADPDFFLMH